ncbi:MAG: hypothetical protein Q4D79_08280 [Propionibacteriaceae bacterium]|nr:hypothetical protein [Propionibacteriaceae bacterium]
MSIRSLINRFLDAEFGAYPAARGIGAGTLPLAERKPNPAPAPVWNTQDWVRAN